MEELETQQPPREADDERVVDTAEAGSAPDTPAEAPAPSNEDVSEAPLEEAAESMAAAGIEPEELLVDTTVEQAPAPTEDASEASLEGAAESMAAAGIEPEELLADTADTTVEESAEAEQLAVLEAIVYVTDEPLTLQQIAAALDKPVDHVRRLLDKLVEEYARPSHGLMVREIAGGYKMATKPEHHEQVRTFVKKLNPPLKLSLAALETLAVIAYKQPITAPEIMEIRGVQGAGVLKTLLDRKLITTAGRKAVIGKPILYKTTKEFLVQFGLKDLNELPTLKEFEELRRLAFGEGDEPVLGAEPPATAIADEAAGGLSGEQPTPAPDEPQPELPAEPPAEPDAEPEPEPEPESPGKPDPETNA